MRGMWEMGGSAREAKEDEDEDAGTAQRAPERAGWRRRAHHELPS